MNSIVVKVIIATSLTTATVILAIFIARQLFLSDAYSHKDKREDKEGE